jgi:glycosyltransferase involved in cell wall biosynthesis
MWLTYHLYHKAPDWLGPTASQALGIPYVVAEASSAPKQAHSPWAAAYKAANKAIVGAELVIILNQADRPCLAPLIDDARRLVSLPPFVDAAPFFHAAENRDRHRRALRRRFALDGDAPVLLVVAMMRFGDKLSSYRVLGRALNRIMDRHWTLVVVGDGAARPDVEQALAALGDRVRWLGRVGEHALPAVYAAADLFVWPAVNEAYGIALLEAQAAGLAVVAGRCGGIPDIVDAGETGCLVPVGDAAACARAVARLLDDPDLVQAMGRRAASRVARRHDLAPASAALAGFLDPLVRAKDMA